MSSPLPSPPISPKATRIRIRPSKRPSSLGTISHDHSDRTPDPGTPCSENKSTVPRTAGQRASKRRQSSIAYYTPTSPSPWSQRAHFNTGSRDGEAMVNGSDNVSRRSSLVLSPRSSSAYDSVSSTDGVIVGTREREPLTLVEKHADLLHFIAQKERTCLELRDQLAAHEKELAELKRKWERIVNQNHDSLPNSPLSAGLSGVAFDGLKEGVRMFAAGFSDLGGVIQDDSSKSNPATVTRAWRETHNNTSGSQHLSMSSTSSLHEGVYTSDRDGEVLMVVTAHSRSRTGSLNHRKRAARTFTTDEPPTPRNAFVPPPAQNPNEASSLDERVSLMLAPSPTLIPPSLANTTTLTKPSLTVSTQEPVSTTTAGSMSSWMDTMGKKLTGLPKSKGPTYSQKRASSFLAGVSNTINAALLPGPTATTPAPLPQTTTTTVARRIPSSTLTAPPLTSTRSLSSSSSSSSRSQLYPTYKTMADWLDDHEDEDEGDHTVELKRQPQAQQAMPVSEVIHDGEAVSSFDDDNDWNW